MRPHRFLFAEGIIGDFDYYGRMMNGTRTASTLDAAIRDFLQALELTDMQEATVANRQALVRERAEKNALMDVENTLLMGSYKRDTQIRSLENGDLIDVDCLFILKSSDQNLLRYWRANDGGRQALSDLRSAIDGYQGIKAVIDYPAVKLTWADMTMEIVPAFNRTGGGYLIPAQNAWTNLWQETDPITDGKKISEVNQATGGEFKPMVKMLKCWNRKEGRILSSFGIETVLFHSVPGYRDFEFEIQHFLMKLREWNNTSLSAPSGIGSPITIQLSFSQNLAVSESKQKIGEAFTLASQGRHREAIEKMAAVFGRPFPGA